MLCEKPPHEVRMGSGGRPRPLISASLSKDFSQTAPKKERHMRRKKLDKRLSKVLAATSEEKRILAEDVLGEMAFLSQVMGDLKADIAENGATEVFRQGSNELDRPSASFQAYIAAVAKFTALVGKVTHLLPKQEVKELSGVETWLRQYDSNNAELQ